MNTILVVEDEAVVRNVLVTILVRANYRVLEADTAEEALEVSEKFEGVIDLVVADHSLKSMTGREVCEWIRRRRPAVKVLQMSGFPKEKLEAEEGLLPDAYFLAKPFLPNVFLGKVRQIMSESGTLADHGGR